MKRRITHPISKAIKPTFFFSKRGKAVLMLLLFLSFLPDAAVAQSWYNSSWLYRKAITIDASKVGAGTHTNFPILISRADTDLQARAQADADDILFTSSDGTSKLSHEIESYTSASGTLVAWVKIPSLASAANTTIYMYYGNASAASQQNRTGTWDASYRGVYHLNAAFADATSNAYNGTNTGTFDMPGKISRCRGFNPNDGGADYIAISGLMGSPSNFTLSAWANLTSADISGAEIISLGDHSLLRYETASGKTTGVTQLGAGSWGTTWSSSNYASGWYYVTYTFNDAGNVQQVYINGQPNGAATTHGASPYYTGGGTNTFIGKHGNGNINMDFNGTIDEVRVSNSVRSAGWVLTEYNNQNNPTTFYSVGTEACNTPAAPTVISPITYCQNATASQLTATGSNLLWGTGTSGSVGGTGFLPTLTWIDGQSAPSTNYTAFTTTSSNVTITSIDYTIPAWQTVTGLRLSLYNYTGTLLATSSTVTTVTTDAAALKVTNVFNYTIAAAGTYYIRASAGSGVIGGDQPAYPITEVTGTVNVTEHFAGGYRCFNNIQFSTASSSSVAPTPSTATIGSTNYTVTQTVNGCTSAPATITVNVNAVPNLIQAPASDLVLRYDFNNNATDASGTGNHGTLQGAPAVVADRNANASSAYSLNGTSEFITTTTSYANPVNFTYVVWFKTTTSTGGNIIGFGNNQTGTSGQKDRLVYMSNSGQLYFGVYPGAIKTINTAASYNDGQWHQVVASLSSANGMKLYVDGSLKANDPAVVSAENFTGWFKIGYESLSGWVNIPGSNYFNGTLDDILMYNRELTEVEVTSLYSNSSGAGSNGPLCPGQTLNLTATSITGATYSWTGPNGFISNVQNPSISNVLPAHAGTYTVTATVSGCSTVGSVAVTIKSAPSATISYSGTPFCTSSTSQAVTHSGTTGGTYSSTAGLSINASTGAINPSASTPSSYTVTYTMVGAECTQTATASVTIYGAPSLSATTTTTCVGGSTGTITAIGSGGEAPYTYSINSGAYQSSATFTGLAAGSYTLNIKGNTGCVVSTTVEVSAFATATDNQNTTGTDSWIGHVYDGTNFNNYIGQYIEPETFNQLFGGATTCFPLTSNGVARSIYTETFSVKYRMTSSKSGLYIADLGSDDGGRLTVDNTIVYNNWMDQAFSSKPRVLMPLNGSSALLYEFYENGGGNQVAFQNLTLVLANTLSSNTAQNICLGGTGVAIGGDTYGALPAGITLSGTGYQWSYSTTPAGARTDISGATNATFTPSASAPFNTPGTYYLYRKATLSSANNISPNPYVATHESNAATIVVTTPASATISYSGSPYCSSGTATVSRSGTSGGTYSSTSGLSINASTGAIDVALSTPGTYTVTYTIAASGGCSVYTATTSITITAAQAASVSIEVSSSTICAGATVTFTATPTNGGTAPMYQWKLNGVNTGTNSATYVSSNLSDGDVVSCVLTSNYSCLSGSGIASSNSIAMTVSSGGTWLGGTSTSWSTASNWGCGVVPTSVMDVIIPGGTSFSPVVSGLTPVCRNLTIQSGATFTLASGSSLSIAASIINNGTFNATEGTVVMNGSSAQTIPASTFSSNTLKSLTVSNASGVTLEGALNLTDVLTISSGSLASNGYLTLKSSATATARVAPITSVAATPISGNVIAERYVPGRRKYRLITSPVTTSSKTVLSPGEEALSIWGNWQNSGVNTTPNAGNLITGGAAADGFDTQTSNASLFTYDDVNRKYTGFTTANGKNTKYTPLKAGVAYYMFVYGDRRNTVFATNPNNTVLAATGTLKTGDQVYTSNSSIPLSNIVGRFTLLGNPYASPIDWATIPRTDVSNTMWGWDPNLSSTGGYITVTTNGTVTLTAPYSGSVGLDQYIQSGQGFYVKTTGASPALTIREQDKVGNFNANAFRTFGRRTTASASRLTNDIPLIAINLQYETAGTKVLADGVLAAFDATFSKEVGEEDATKMANSAEALSIMNGNDLLSIDGRRLPTIKDTLYLNTVKLTKAQYTLQVFTKKIGGDMQVFLEDSYRNTSQQLVLNDTNTVVFNVSASEPLSAATNRFKIVFAPTVALPVKFVSVKAAEKNAGVQVEWSVGEQSGIEKYEVERSADGVHFNKISEVPVAANSTHAYQWTDASPVGGSNYYRIRAIEDGRSYLSMVVVVNIQEGKAAVKVSPNPVREGQINLQLMQLQKGKYTLQLVNVQGQLIHREMVEHAGGSSILVLHPKKLAAGVYYLQLANESSRYEQKIFVE